MQHDTCVAKATPRAETRRGGRWSLARRAWHWSAVALLATASFAAAPDDAPSPLRLPATGLADELFGDSPGMPAALYVEMARSLARDATSEYRIDSRGRGANRRRDLELRFTPEGALVDGTDARFALHLASFGRGNRNPVRRAMPNIDGAWVEYDRAPGLREWFVNLASGVEQGWIVSEPPAGKGHLSLEIYTDRPRDDEAAGHLAWSGDVYHSLRAFDADGQALPSRWGRDGRRLRVEVDDRDAIYPIVIGPWIQQAELVASDLRAHYSFGASVAISGDTALVGTPGADVGNTTNQGAAYVFIRNGCAWTEQAKLAASEGMEADDFGISVALSGDTALVGAVTADVEGNTGQGAAYVYTREGESWSQEAILTPLDGDKFDSFGRSVALSGNTALVAAETARVGANLQQGATYVFSRGGGIWSEQAKLTASDGEGGDAFGASVSISGGTALVGAPRADIGDSFGQGAAYVFVQSGGVWIQQAKLIASDGEGGDSFGTVALSGDTALVGAPEADVGESTKQGAAYVFIRNDGAWSQEAKLVAADGEEFHRFGNPVSLSGGIAVIGVARATVGDNTEQGAAYVFARNGALWDQNAKLTAEDGEEIDQFGSSVSVMGDTLVVGTGPPFQRAAYAFSTAALCPSGLDVDPLPLSSDGNGVFEPGELVDMAPGWRNDGSSDVFADGILSTFSGPEGASYEIVEDGTGYGPIPPGHVESCQDSGVACYQLAVQMTESDRPAQHWDATVDEELQYGDDDFVEHGWTLHVGDSFTDVPRANIFYTGIETLLHSGVTGGCGDGTAYCPADANTRSQMPAFMLRALMGADYTPPACEEGEERMFADVPASNLFCSWIEDLVGRGIVSGCGDDNYCPNDAVTRAQMAIFLLKTLEGPDYVPTECTNRFTDVPCSSIFADWIEDLAVREITGGCSEDEYCPADAVTRGQMASFITKTFGFTLYGP